METTPAHYLMSQTLSLPTILRKSCPSPRYSRQLSYSTLGVMQVFITIAEAPVPVAFESAEHTGEQQLPMNPR